MICHHFVDMMHDDIVGMIMCMIVLRQTDVDKPDWVESMIKVMVLVTLSTDFS